MEDRIAADFIIPKYFDFKISRRIHGEMVENLAD